VRIGVVIGDGSSVDGTETVDVVDVRGNAGVEVGGIRVLVGGGVCVEVGEMVGVGEGVGARGLSGGAIVSAQPVSSATAPKRKSIRENFFRRFING
jgi:hypothetical protein